MRHLSSGEKQIVSLFTHVYIGDGPGLIILIDEPELSLSVPWQKQLLPDIRRSDRCRFLAAVTHSPFIFDNEIKRNATDLRQCIIDR
jgi:predicted ATPase